MFHGYSVAKDSRYKKPDRLETDICQNNIKNYVNVCICLKKIGWLVLFGEIIIVCM